MKLETTHPDRPHSERTILQIVRGELVHRAVLVAVLGVTFGVAAVLVKTSDAERLFPLLKWVLAP